MADVRIDPATAAAIARLRAEGCVVFGPAPNSPSQAMATGDVTEPSPGLHIQIGRGHRWVEGFGGTPAEALADARSKLAPYEATEKVHPL